MTRELNWEDRLIKKQILSLNRHLPKRRKNLKELLEEEKPHVIGADGTRHRFKRAELKIIASIIPKNSLGRLKLPLYIEIDSKTSGSRIAGQLECDLICTILGKENCGEEIYIYRPDIKVVRQKLPTTTQYIFLVR